MRERSTGGMRAAAARLAIAILLTTACSSPATATPSASKAIAATSPKAETLACRLPVTWTSWDPATRIWAETKAGFLSLSDLSLAQDPGGLLVPVTDSVARTPGSHSLSGSRTVRYDPARHRWLPGGIASPDNSSYAYGDDQLRVHVVDIDSGADRVVTGPGSWGPVGWLTSGLYVAHLDKSESAMAGTTYSSVGLWLVDPSSGSSRQINSQNMYWEVSSLGAWGLDRPAGDPLGQGPNRLLRLDLASGKVDEWYHWPDMNAVHILTFDPAGLPIAQAEPGQTTSAWLVKAPKTIVTLLDRAAEDRPSPPTAADSHGVWFSGFGWHEPYSGPIWLYTPQTGLRIVASKPPLTLTVAGPCS